MEEKGAILNEESSLRQCLDYLDFYDASLLNGFSTDMLRQFRDYIDWNFYIFNITSNFHFRDPKVVKEFTSYLKNR